MSPLIRHPKRRGEWVELQFMARAAAHGLTVSKPWGDCARYDFVVENPNGFHRVQVKSTFCAFKNGYMCMCRPSSRKLAPYSSQQIDFIAAYVIPEDVWYIIPIAAVSKIRNAICLAPRQPRSKYHPYLEAWQLLKTAESAPADARK